MKSNRIKALFDEKGKEILSVYFCAGFPKAENTHKQAKMNVRILLVVFCFSG